MQLAAICVMDRQLKIRAKSRHMSIVMLMGLCLFLLPAIPSSQAEFTLNFIPDDGAYSSNRAYVSCGMSYISDANCSSGGGMGGGNNYASIGAHQDGTPFYQRMFDDAQGNRYYQVIIGDYTLDNFAMDIIIKANSADGTWYSGIARSASAGDPADRLYNMTQPYDTATTDPLKSGTGTGNPTRVIMKQILKDAESDMVFIKDTFANKPLITQDITTADMASVFSIDMRAKDHADITPITLNEIINTLTLTGADTYGTAGDFDIKTDSEAGVSNISAGGYTYTPGTNYGESDGTYAYVNEAIGDTFQPSGINYADFCDANQNPDWSGNGACKNGDGTGGGGGGGWGGGGMGGGRGGFGW